MVIDLSPEALAKLREKAGWARDYGDQQEAADAIERLALIDALEEARAQLDQAQVFADARVDGAKIRARAQAFAECEDFVRRHGEEEIADAMSARKALA